MAKKNKNLLYLGLTAIGLGALYMATKKKDKAPAQNQATDKPATSTTTKPANAKPLDYNLMLTVGSKGPEVMQLQRYLGITDDGIFGSAQTLPALVKATGLQKTSLNGYLNIIAQKAKTASSQTQKNEVTFKYPTGKKLNAAVDFTAYYYTNSSGAWKNTDKYGDSLGFVDFKKGAEVGTVYLIDEYNTPTLYVLIPEYRRGAKRYGENLSLVKVKGSWVQ